MSCDRIGVLFPLHCMLKWPRMSSMMGCSFGQWWLVMQEVLSGNCASTKQNVRSYHWLLWSPQMFFFTMETSLSIIPGWLLILVCFPGIRKTCTSTLDGKCKIQVYQRGNAAALSSYLSCVMWSLIIAALRFPIGKWMVHIGLHQIISRFI